MNLKKIKIDGDLLGLDVGDRRTGVARMHAIARISEPLPPIVIESAELLAEKVAELIHEYSPSVVVVGLPRGLDGQDTEQTKKIEKFVKQLENIVSDTQVFMVDEAGTTKEAEQRARNNQSIDSVAACIILETFAEEVQRGRIANVSF